MVRVFFALDESIGSDHYSMRGDSKYGYPLHTERSPLTTARPPCKIELSTQAELGDQGTVPLDILILQVVEKAPALADHHEKSSAGVMILFVDLQVLREMVDSLSDERNLDLG